MRPNYFKIFQKIAELVFGLILIVAWQNCSSGRDSIEGNSVPTATPVGPAMITPVTIASNNPLPLASLNCGFSDPTYLQSLEIYNGSGGISLSSSQTSSLSYFQVGDNPMVNWTYSSSGLSFVYDVEITSSQFIFKSLKGTDNLSSCSITPGTRQPPGINFGSPCSNSQSLSFNPFAANYSFSCIGGNLIVLELDFPDGPIFFSVYRNGPGYF